MYFQNIFLDRRPEAKPGTGVLTLLQSVNLLLAEAGAIPLELPLELQVELGLVSLLPLPLPPLCAHHAQAHLIHHTAVCKQEEKEVLKAFF